MSLPTTTLTMDKMMYKLGTPGRYQVVVLLLLATNLIPVVINHLLVISVQGTEHHCKVPSGGPPSLFIPQATNSTLQSCKMYQDPSNSSQGYQPCVEGHTFVLSSENRWSTVAEWSLVCEREHLTTVIRNTYLGGMMVGGIIFGILSDRLGRRGVMLACLYSQSLIGIGLYFVQEFWVFVGLRCAQGMLIQGLLCVTNSLAVEMVSPDWRTLAVFLLRAVWSAGLVLCVVVTRYVEHWRFVQLAVNIPAMATLAYIWFIPESLRWLLSKGKVKQADKVVSSIHSYNSLKVDSTSLQLEMEAVSRDLVSSQDARRPSSILDIFQVSGIGIKLGVLSFAWFSVSMCSHGMSHYVPILSGDEDLDRMLGAGIELGAFLLVFVINGGFGRRAPLCLYLSVSGTLSILIILVKTLLPETLVNVESLVIGLSLVGRASAVSSYITILLYVCEIFPTVIRAAALGSCTFFAGAGSLLAPYSFLLGQKLSSNLPALVPFIAFGVMCLVAAVLIFLLPETLDANLPDTIKEAICVSVRARHKSSDSLDVGYGKCPEFVCVDGLIVSKDNAWTDNEESTVGTLRSRISSQTESDSSPRESIERQTRIYEEISSNSSMSFQKEENKLKDNQVIREGKVQSWVENLPSCSRDNMSTSSRGNLSGYFRDNLSSCSRDNLVSSNDNLVPTEQDCSVVSAESSMIYESDAKDEAIMEMMRRKLLVMEGEETKL